MNRAAALVAVAAMVGGAVYFTRQAQATTCTSTPDGDATPPDAGAVDAGSVLGEVGGQITEMVDTVKSQLNNLTTDPRDALADPNVRVFLSLIRVGEGTSDTAGYSRLFGGKLFAGFDDHPRISVPFGSAYSTAAGAYQILKGTWDEMAAKYDLPDFSPASQDVAAVGLIKRRGALGDVLAGRFATAIEKCNKEWASLPNSPYGQPTITMRRAADILAGLGVTSVEVMA